jgi:hypothetical protein
MDDNAEEQALVAWLLASGNDYLGAKVLADGSVAVLHDLIFTRSIMLGVTRDSWRSRFCFEDRQLATQRFADLQGEDDVPAGYTAVRGHAAHLLRTRPDFAGAPPVASISWTLTDAQAKVIEEWLDNVIWSLSSLSNADSEGGEHD